MVTALHQIAHDGLVVEAEGHGLRDVGSYFLIGAAWAAMLALPFTLLTNALEGNPYMGSYLGLFNCTICLPQIIAAATGGLVLRLAGGSQAAMLAIAGVFLVLGAVCVRFIQVRKQK